MNSIPASLTPFLQEYDPSRLDCQRDRNLLIERTLQFGDRAELRWLFATYGVATIREWVRRFGQERLPQPHRNFWQVMLEEQG